MRRIYKYNIVGNTIFNVKMPAGAKVLTVGVQRDLPVMWAEVDTEKADQTYRFVVLGTGEDFPASIRAHTYIGTFFISAYVWHLYEIILK